MGCQLHASSTLPTGKRPVTHFTLGWVGPSGRSGRVRKISALPGFNPWPAQSVTIRYTDWPIPAHILGTVGNLCHKTSKTSDCTPLRAIKLRVAFPVSYFIVKLIWTTTIIPSRIFYSEVNKPEREAKHSPLPATVFHNICGPAAVTHMDLSSMDKFDLGHRLDRPPVNLVINLDWCYWTRVALTAVFL